MYYSALVELDKDEVNAMDNRYVTISKDAVMYTTVLNTNILVREKKGERINYKYFGINNTGKMILESITGTKTVEEFIHDFVEMTQINYEKNKGWIKEFLNDLREKGVVLFEKKICPCEKIRNIGSENLISPMHATIEVTDKCNLKCKHCYLEASPENGKMLSLENFKKVLHELESNMVVNVEFTGGELFVNPEIYEILKLAYQKFTIIGILTNGVSLREDALDLLVRNKDRTVVNVSIDSTDSNTHDQFRGVPGSFEKTCANIRKMTQRGITVRMASSIFKENMWEIDKLAQLALELGAKLFSFNFVEEFGRGNTLYQDAYQDIKVKEYFEYLNAVIKKYEGIIPIQQGEEILGKRNCGAGVNSIVIDAEGKIRPCVLAPAWCDMGNLMENSFEDIMKKDIYKKLAAILPPCKENGCNQECRYLSYCRGCYLKGFQTCKNNGEACAWIRENKLEELYNLFVEGSL